MEPNGKIQRASNVRFGAFNLDVRAGELRKTGLRIRLQEQPLQILRMLLERPGEVVLRQEIRDALWPNGTVVEFDHGINAAVKRLRDALVDSAEKPRYIETLPRRGYRFIGSIVDGEATGGDGSAITAQEESSAVPDINRLPPPPLPFWRSAWIPSMAIIFLALTGGWYYRLSAPARWAREVALPEAAALVTTGQFPEAFSLIYRALQVLPGDPALNKLHRDISYPVMIRTTPPQADVYIKPYATPNGEWLYLGQSPLANFQLPTAYFRWKVTKPGFRNLEAAAGIQSSIIEFTLDSDGSVPPEMVYVTSGDSHALGSPAVPLDGYLIDKYEVTNKQFKEFVDHGGYQNLDYWREDLVSDGRPVSRQNALAAFRDVTGRLGPATWEVGSYPAGRGDFPVGGVSWYEAAAYAVYAKKQLPTVFHWYRAAGQGIYSDVLAFANLSGEGPVQVGSRQGIGAFGTYDMAGNVREWCSNSAGSRRYILGGSWNGGRSSYADPDTRSPFDRSASNGFRCVRYNAAVATSVSRPIETSWVRDYRTEKPVSDAQFRVIQSIYSYDHTDLNAKVESVDASSPGYRTEKITFDAAYDREKMSAELYIPNGGKPPYQTIVYFPAGASGLLDRVGEVEIHSFQFLMKSGRAVLLPIYKGTFDRRRGIPSGASAQRDVMVRQFKDFRRAVDYLETRSDIDAGRLGYFGISAGARMGLIILAQEPRIRAAALAAGGLASRQRPQEIDGINFAPRIRVPVLMLNGRDDFPIAVETLQKPMFQLLGSRENEKRFVQFDSGHAAPPQLYVKEALDWFDRFLGPVSR